MSRKKNSPFSLTILAFLYPDEKVLFTTDADNARRLDWPSMMTHVWTGYTAHENLVIEEIRSKIHVRSFGKIFFLHGAHLQQPGLSNKSFLYRSKSLPACPIKEPAA
jgi:hypothetical protein